VVAVVVTLIVRASGGRDSADQTTEVDYQGDAPKEPAGQLTGG
jgi:hypothetical protein